MNHRQLCCTASSVYNICISAFNDLPPTIRVFSWGEGDDGKLGHCSRLSCDKPRLIEALKSKRVRDIACGSSHSAAITSSGELYTWGCGEYGRLGHGDNVTQLRPKQVSEDTFSVRENFISCFLLYYFVNIPTLFLRCQASSQLVDIISDVGQVEETNGGLEVPLGMRVLGVAPALARVR